MSYFSNIKINSGICTNKSIDEKMQGNIELFYIIQRIFVKITIVFAPLLILCLKNLFEVSVGASRVNH